MIAIPSVGTRSKQLLGATIILVILTITGINLPSSTRPAFPVDHDGTQILQECSHSDHTGWSSWFSSNSPVTSTGTTSPETILTSSIEGYAQAYLSSLVGAVNTTYYHDTQGLNLANTDLHEYTTELVDNYNHYFSSRRSRDKHTPWLAAVKSRLSLRPPTLPLPDCPKQVMTTDKSIRHIPREFRRWNQIMPEWNTRYFDDAGLVEWVDVVFGGTKAQSVWEELPRRVLQTDVFRYMAMLVEGGIYTDSDTAPIIHANQWGRPYSDITPPALTHLSRVLSLAKGTTADSAPHPPEGPARNAGHDMFNDAFAPDGGELEEPALVISIEADGIEFGWDDWRERHMARAVQMTQWTFMARPGHPVFLDALGRTLRQAEEVAAEKAEARKAGKPFMPPSALEWTGPGVFTDCVYRYLLARYGIHPEELVGWEEPFRIGDVLILPAGSFSSVSPFDGEKQRPWAATWHGFYGRWRQEDPKEHSSGKKLSVEEIIKSLDREPSVHSEE